MAEIEILHQLLSQLKADKIIKLYPNLRDLLKDDGLNDRSPRKNYNRILTKTIKTASKHFFKV